MPFTKAQNEALAAKLDASNVKSRQQAGRSLSYIEGWVTIDEANRIFGFDGWTRETVETRLVQEHQRKIGKEPSQREGWGVSYVCRVRVVVFAGDTIVTREGIGAGHGIDVDLGLAHESAVKEAETDAMKRALMTFGNPFGLALYDKSQENVERHPTSREERAADPFADIERNMLATISNMLDPAKLDRLAVSERFAGDLAALPDPHRTRVGTALRARKATLAAMVVNGH